MRNYIFFGLLLINLNMFAQTKDFSTARALCIYEKLLTIITDQTFKNHTLIEIEDN